MEPRILSRAWRNRVFIEYFHISKQKTYIYLESPCKEVESEFLISISEQPNVIDLKYFKPWFPVDKII